LIQNPGTARLKLVLLLLQGSSASNANNHGALNAHAHARYFTDAPFVSPVSGTLMTDTPD
jgi:hypothetical protein